MIETVKCVIGANFGDEGKGLMTDYFAYQHPGETIVVLHNGGAQRGHTVETPEGYRHVFHHFGAGTFAEADTYMAKKFLVNPILFRDEYFFLAKKAKNFNKRKIFINPNCLLTTIFDMLVNQAIEEDRGTAKHGSCGLGIYETLYRNQADLDFKATLLKKKLNCTVKEFAMMSFNSRYDFLEWVCRWYVEHRFNDFKLHHLSPTFQKILTNPHIVIINFIDDFNFMIEHSEFAEDNILQNYKQVIFESGQGLLLDQHNMEYFPHLTPSNTGMQNPAEILSAIDYRGNVEACYVTRTYLTRHGAGRLDDECSKKSINSNMIDMTNVPNPFQDSLRYAQCTQKVKDAMMDRILADTRQAGCNQFFNIFPSLAVTHTNEKATYFRARYLSSGLTRNEVLDSCR